MYLVERRLSANPKLIDILIITVATVMVMCLASLAIHIVNMSAITDVAGVPTSSESRINFNSRNLQLWADINCASCHFNSIRPISANNNSRISPLILTNSEDLSKQLEAIKQQDLSRWLMEL